MRILRLTRRLPPFPGGQEVHILELTRRQLQAGHDVEVWYVEGSELPPGAVRHNVSAKLLGYPLQGLAATSLYAWRASRTMRSVPADIVHVHGDFPEAWFGHRAAMATRMPVVMTVHGGLNRRHVNLSRVALRTVDHFFAHGNRVAADLRACDVPAERVTIISSGLDFELLAPHQHGPGPERPRLVTVGALDPMKNHETLIAAAALIRERHPDLELVVIGEGRERRRLERIASNNDQVRFTGQLPRPDVYDIVSRSSVFSLASRRLRGKGEGVPTAVLEAMALGRPCVVSDACVPDAIADRSSGAYRAVDTNTPEAFAAAISDLLDDQVAAREMGSRAESAVAGVGWDDVAARVEAQYEAVLGSRARRP